MKFYKFLLIPLITFIVFSFNSFRPVNKKEIIQRDSSSVVTISFVGDLMCHSPQYEYARINKDSFDFRPVFRFIKKYLYSDLIIGNLETVFAGEDKRYSGYPMFNSPDDYLTAVKDAGFNFVFTSNNHSLDRGEYGVISTINKLNKLSICHTGTYSSQRDMDSIRIVNIKGIKIALLAYSYGTNGNEIPAGKEYLINLIDENKIKVDIEKVKNKYADLVLCYFHFGEEYQRLPNKYQKDLVEKAISFGADLIIGSHPHVIQPVGFYKSKYSILDSVFTAFSLGNFISNQQKRYCDAGVILNIKLKKDWIKNKIKLENIHCVPTWVYKGKTERGNEYLVLPSSINTDDSVFIFLNRKSILKIRQSYYDTKSILTKWTKSIQIR